MTLAQSGTHRLGRGVTRLGRLAAVLVLVTVPLLAPQPAFAHRDPTLIVRIVAPPALPEGVSLEILDSELSYFVLRNEGTDPVRALDPDGRPFLQVSSDGVYGDLTSSHLAASPRARDADPVQLNCCPQGTWVRLSTSPTWIWADPRLDPPLRDDGGDDARGLGGLGTEPLATWRATFASVDGEIDVDGVVERKQVGAVATRITSAPSSVEVTIIEARPPMLRLVVPRGTRLELLSDDGSPLVRSTPDGVLADAGRPEHAAHVRAARLPEAAQTEGWVPLVGSRPGRLTWADPRLDYSSNLPAAGTVEATVINTWEIDLVVDGVPEVITGESTWEPASLPPPNEEVPRAGFWRGLSSSSAAAAGALTLIAGLGYALARSRKKEDLA